MKQVDLIDEDGNRLVLSANPNVKAVKIVNIRGYYGLVSVDPNDVDGSGEATSMNVEVPVVARSDAVKDFFAHPNQYN